MILIIFISLPFRGGETSRPFLNIIIKKFSLINFICRYGYIRFINPVKKIMGDDFFLSFLNIFDIIFAFIFACVVEVIILFSGISKTPRHSNGTYKKASTGAIEHIIYFIILFFIGIVFSTFIFPIITSLIIQNNICMGILILTIIIGILIFLIYIFYSKNVRKRWGF